MTMAYDPNCAETKAAIKKIVAEAVAEAEEAHEEDIQGLKKKNRELIADLKEARKGNGGEGADPAEITRLEDQLRESNKALRSAEKRAKDAEDEAELARTEATTEKAATTKLLTENGLTAALTKANVKAELLPGAIAMLSGKVEIKEVAGKREAFAGGKPLGEFVQEWSQGDEGKHYVGAADNGGGGGKQTPNTPNPSGGSKKLSEMSVEERTALAKDDPTKLASLVAADRAEARAKARSRR